jgi:hypothetical protein
MQVQAMFYVASILKRASGGDPTITVELLPVTRNVAKEPHSSAHPNGTYESPNVQWSKYTPSGKIEMTITAVGAQEFFESRLSEDVPITFG